jgi:CHAT domain-containing protein
MKKRTSFFLLVLLVTAYPVQSVSSGSFTDGVSLYEDAFQIDVKAQSRKDFERACDKYEQALKIFEKTGSLEWQSKALEGMAWILRLFGHNAKAETLYCKKLSLCEKLGSESSKNQTLYALGTLFKDLANYPKGIEVLNLALVSARQSGSTETEGAIYSGLGAIYRETGDYPKAIEMFSKSLDLSRKTLDSPAEVIDLLNLGRLYMDMGYPEDAERFLILHVNSVTKIAESLGQNPSAQGLAGTYLALADYCRGLNLNSGTREIRRQFTDVFIEDMGLNTFSTRGPQGDRIIYKRMGETSQALATYQWTIDIQEKFGDTIGQSMTFNSIGLIHKTRGEFSKALDSFQKSLDISSRIGALYGQAVTLNNVANVYAAWGDNSRALDLLEQSIAIKKKIGSRSSEAYSYMDLGDLMRSWGLHEKALNYYENAFKLHESCGQALATADSMIRQGSALISMERYDQALARLEKGLALTRSAKGHENWPCDIIGNLFLDLGNMEQAEKYLIQGGYYSSLARFAMAKSDIKSAHDNYTLLLENSEKDGNLNSRFMALTGLATINEKKGDLKQAERLYDEAMKLIEELRAGLLPSERKNFYDVRMGGFYRSEPAKGLARARMKLNQPLESVEPSETIRARSFADNLAIKRLEDFPGVPRDVLNQEDILISTLASLKKRLSGLHKKQDKALWQNISGETERAKIEMDNFIQFLWKDYRPYAQIKYPKPVSIEKSGLRPNETTIIFDALGEGVGVKLLKGTELVKFYYVPWKQSDLENDTNQFRRSFDNVKLRDFDVGLGKKLYQKLLEPALCLIPKGTRLTLIPDGILSILPFEALVVSGIPEWRTGLWGNYPYGLSYMADYYSISYQQSLTSLTLAREDASKTPKTGKRLLIISDPVFQINDARAEALNERDTRNLAPDNKNNELMMAIEDFERGSFKFDRLPETSTLAENLSELFPAQADVFTGLRASKKTLLDRVTSEIVQYDMLIFATHGLFNSRIPGISGPFLALSMVPPGTDGFLTITDVMKLNLNLSLVALTACQTGLGKHQAGEGVMSMGSAFLYAGARSVIMSLWSVAEKSSVILTESFFRNLKEGKDKITSIQLAREEIRQKGFEHPFFWASFILLGASD